MTHHGHITTGTTTRSVASERSDNELLAAYAAGDNEAFGEFVRRYHDFVVAVAAKRIGAASWHDAEDAANNAWIKVMGNVGALGPDGVGDVKNWLAAYVLNQAISIKTGYARRRSPVRDPQVLGEVISAQGYRLPGASGPAEAEGQEDREVREEQADALAARFKEALAGLTPLQREVMTRRLHDRSLTGRQIADELGRTLESVKGAEQAGRRNLRRALADLVEEPVPEPVPAAAARVVPAAAARVQVLSPRRLLLIDRLRDNPAMTGPEAKIALDQAGLGPVSARAARKVLSKARVSLAATDQEVHR